VVDLNFRVSGQNRRAVLVEPSPYAVQIRLKEVQLGGIPILSEEPFMTDAMIPSSLVLQFHYRV
jgi:hypothetical protein